MAFAIDGFSATFKATRGGIVDNLKAAAVYADATMETKTKGLEAAGVTIITQNMTQRDIGDIGVIIFTSLRRFERRGLLYAAVAGPPNDTPRCALCSPIDSHPCVARTSDTFDPGDGSTIS